MASEDESQFSLIVWLLGDGPTPTSIWTAQIRLDVLFLKGDTKLNG